jgi:chromosome partitioning protein
VPDYDLVLIDCQPSLGLLTINALAAADGIIVPLECEYFAMRGVKQLFDTIDMVRQRINPKLRVTGILATMYDGRTLHAREVVASIAGGQHGHLLYSTLISRTVKFPDSTVAQEPITTFAPGSSAAASYRTLAREVLARTVAR